MIRSREEILQELWLAQDEAYDLMYEYDTLPHHYGANVLYQAEGTIINLIGRTPGVTITDLAAMLKRTPSACSQIVRKLRDKGWVAQTRNEQNNRQYNLSLTESGREVFDAHLQFNLDCQKEMFAMLTDFTDEELAMHMTIQKKINDAYRMDVARSRERFAE